MTGKIKEVKPKGCPNSDCTQASKNECYNCGYYDYIPCQLNEPKVETEAQLKEGLIEGLEDIIAKNGLILAACLMAELILTYLASHGFGDIEQARKEERKRIFGLCQDHQPEEGEL